MEKMLIADLLKDGDYFNIVLCLMAIEKPDPTYLAKAFGDKAAFDEIRKTLGYKEFCSQHADISFNPIALTPNGYIYMSHFQVAGAILAGKKEIGVMRKKIPCDYQLFGVDWLQGTFDSTSSQTVESYLSELLLRLS